MMKVLLVNGSPHKEGCTYTALCEVSKALNALILRGIMTGLCLERRCIGVEQAVQ